MISILHDYYDPNAWDHGVLTGYCSNPFNCVYGTCFPFCAVASAKTLYDGSDWFFNILCFSCNFPLVRNYIRQGYEIKGRIGLNDCCFTVLCFPLAVTQLLNEVSVRGQLLINNDYNNKKNEIEDSELQWKMEESSYSFFIDPYDFFCTYLCCSFEVMSLYSHFAGVPCWFSCCPGGICVNICQLRHLVRKSYGISGSDFYGDFVETCLCMLVPVINCTYFFKLLSILRSEIEERGIPHNFSFHRRKRYEIDQNVIEEDFDE